MRIPKPVIVILFILTLPFFALARQVNLTGRLIDEQNNPLAGGSIILGELWADTDVNGNFQLVGDYPGEIVHLDSYVPNDASFVVAKMGFLPITKPFTTAIGDLGDFILKKRLGPVIPMGKGQLENSNGKAPFVFIVTGKVSMGTKEYDGVMKSINKINPDFNLDNGDAINPTTLRNMDANYADFIRRSWTLDSPGFMCMGNHEVNDKSGMKGYNKWISLYGPAYYSFVHKGAQFIIMAFDDRSECDDVHGAVGPKQLAWLKETLTSVKADRRYVMFHRPLWIETPEINSGSAAMRSNFNDNIKPLFEKYNVDAVFSSHYTDWKVDEINNVRYIGNRMNDNKGMNGCFLKVTVPASGRAQIMFMHYDTEHPEYSSQ